MTLEEIILSENSDSFNAIFETITHPKEIIGYLDTLAEKYPSAIIKKLNQGDSIQNGNSIYIIDDLEEICNQVYDKSKLCPGKIPLKSIYNAFRIPQNGFINGEINFSEVLKNGEGMCFEHAVLTHLFAQKNEENPSYLIGEGYLMEEKGARGPHAFNIISKEGKFFLVDSQNPLGGESYLGHYTAPIIGIKPYGNEIVIEDSWKQGRQYSIL